MKKHGFVLALAGLVFATCITMTGCGGNAGGGITPPPPPPEKVSVACVDHIQVGVSSPETYTCAATVTNATNTAVTWSVDNPSLATIDANGVLTPNQSTTGTINVTATSVEDATKTGTASVKVSDRILYGTYSGIWIANQDGTGAVNVLPGEKCLDANWFADHLGFACTMNNNAGNQAQIYTTDGTNAGTKAGAILTFAGLIQVDHVTPSPDSKTVLFIAMDPSKSDQQGTYTASAKDGNNVRALVQETPCSGVCPGIDQARYSHDGKLIVFTHIVNYGQTIWLMNADGSNQTPLVDIPNFLASQGAFTADDTGVFFFGGSPDGSNSGIYTVEVAGGTPSSTPLIVGGIYAVPLTDGINLVYSKSGVWSAHLDGSDPKQISASGGSGN